MPRKATAGTKEIEDLADRLHSTAIHLLRLVRVEDAAAGIAPARLSALSVIVFAGPVSLADLARAEQVKPPTMSRIVDALVAQGLVQRRVNRKDRRAVLIEATASGIAMLHEGRRRRVRLLAEYLSRLTVSERRHLDRALEAIEGAFWPADVHKLRVNTKSGL